MDHTLTPKEIALSLTGLALVVAVAYGSAMGGYYFGINDGREDAFVDCKKTQCAQLGLDAADTTALTAAGKSGRSSVLASSSSSSTSSSGDASSESPVTAEGADEHGTTTSPDNQSATIPATVGSASDPSNYLSSANPFSEKEIQEKFVRYQVPQPLDTSALGFEMVGPKDWPSLDLKASRKSYAERTKHPVQLAEFDGHAPDVSLAVWFMEVPTEKNTTLSQFFAQYCQSLSLTAVQKHEDTNRLEAIVKYDTDKSKTMLARMTILRMGKNIIWLSCRAPESSFSHLSNTFSVAASTFSPVGYQPSFHPDVISKSISGSAFDSD